MRVLIVYEDSHRAYGEAMVGAIRASRPDREEVSLAHLRELEAELERFDPHLVVSSRPNTLEPGARAAWVLLSDDPDEPSEVCIDGRHRRLENPGLEQILEIIDETEVLVRTGRELRGC
jgi:F420-dependent methylenetetrahydromethanopterin dehydrogenase